MEDLSDDERAPAPALSLEPGLPSHVEGADDAGAGPEGYYDLVAPGDEGDGAQEEEEEGDGEDLVAEGMERDYQKDPELDRYDEELLDRATYAPATAAQRAGAEEAIERRERAAAERRLETAGARRRVTDVTSSWLNRLPALRGMEEDEGEEGEGDEDEETAVSASQDGVRARRGRPPARRRKVLYDDASRSHLAIGLDLEDEDVVPGAGGVVGESTPVEQIEGSLKKWLALDATRREVGRRFVSFLTTFREQKAQGQGPLLYKKRIESMCSENKESLSVSFYHLNAMQPVLSTWVAEEPAEMLALFDEATTLLTLRWFPEYRKMAKSGIHVRIADLPVGDSLRDLRQFHLNHLIKVTGVVTRRTAVFPQLVAVKYDCTKCGYIIGPFATTVNGQQQLAMPTVTACPACQSRGPFSLNVDQTLYRNYQKLTLQESPGSVPPGRLPRSKEIILLHDLIDSAKPGEEVDVIGVFRHNYEVGLNKHRGFPVYATIIEANNVLKKDDALCSLRLSDEDEQAIRKLATDDRIVDRIASSIAPSICGHMDVKLGLALAMFGGQTRILQDRGQHRIRGDINVLLLGDPGTAKSQFLKYVEKTAPRAVFTTGKGSTAVGLTAAVHKDALTHEWTLEGGALVLADRGVCLIDEFDKMNDKDRTSIHEAMEQQSISISKAGIVTTLQARCAVIAAANPLKGRYDSTLNLNQNVELTEPILSRFDLQLVVRDVVDPEADESLARFVVGSHMQSHPSRRAAAGAAPGGGAAALEVPDTNLIPQDLLKKYLMYARSRVEPKWLGSSENSKIANAYAEMRQESEVNGTSIGMRHVEATLRLAEASARMHLREYVREEDVNLALRVMTESFIGTHKFSTAQTLKRKFAKFLSYGRDNNQLLYNQLQTLVRQRAWLRHMGLASQAAGSQQDLEIDREEFEDSAKKLHVSDYRPFYNSKLFRSNFELRADRIVKKQQQQQCH